MYQLKRRDLVFAAAAMLVMLLGPFPAGAMSIEPMVLDISAIGKNTRQSFKVTNDGAQPLPIDIAASRVHLGLNGEQKTEAATDELLIYPPQAMIAPGASQVFRVQWVGDPQIAKSQTYMLGVGQVPVKLAKGTSGIQIVMSFGVTVNVSPVDGKSEIVVLSAAPVAGKDGKRLAAVTVKNPGNKHAYLQKSSILLSGGGWSAEMKPGDIAQKVGLGIVQPGTERRFVLPVEVPKNVSQIQATVKPGPGG